MPAKHNIFRDFIVYSIASFTGLWKTNKITNYFKELSQFSRWYRFRNSEEGTLHFQIPWLVFGSIDFLDKWLKPSMTIFEYGSGGSTLYFAKRVSKIFSIEHDPEWFAITKQAINKAGITNVAYQLIQPEEDADYSKKNYLIKEDCLSVRKEFAGKNFTKYVKSINQLDNNSIDLVVVDGRARQSCIAFSIPKIKKDGILLLDNAERNYYLIPNPELNDHLKWKRLDYIGHFPFAPASILNRTSIFIKLY
ncbi:MAG: hypothetical protein ABI237_06605 [Ginsengibacter sp.]